MAGPKETLTYIVGSLISSPTHRCIPTGCDFVGLRLVGHSERRDSSGISSDQIVDRGRALSCGFEPGQPLADEQSHSRRARGERAE
jgi:hypothetical protein